MKFSTVSLILALSAAPAAIFVHGTNYHSLSCDTWEGICDFAHDHEEEERRTLLEAQFDDAVTAGTKKRPTRKLSKHGPPLPPRPVFCDEFKLYWNTTAWKETIIIQGSPTPQRGTKTCALSNERACRGDTAQSYFDLYTDPALTTYGGRLAETELIVEAVFNINYSTLQTGSIEVDTRDFGGEIMYSNKFGDRFEITAGSKSYLGATGTIALSTKFNRDFKLLSPGIPSAVGEIIIRCELSNPSNP